MTRFSKSVAVIAALGLTALSTVSPAAAGKKSKSCSCGQQQPAEDCGKKEKEPSLKKQFKEICSPIKCTKKGKSKCGK